MTSTAAPLLAAAPMAVDGPYPSLREAACAIAVLFVITLMAQLDRQLPALLVRPLREEFALSDTAFSVLQGYAFALAFTLAGLPLGRWVDRGQRVRLLLVGLMLWSAATAGFAFGRSYEELLLARVGVGIGEAVLAPAAYSLIADLVAPQRCGRALAVYGVSIAVGSGASLLLGGWLLSVIPPAGLVMPVFGEMAAWRIAFLAAAVPGVPLALLLWMAVREPTRQHDTTPGPGGSEAISLRDFIDHLRRHSATFGPLLIYPTVLSYLGYGALAWAPALFERSHGIPAARSGVVLGGLVAVAGAIGMLAGGWLSDHWEARTVPAARLRVALLGLAVAALPAVLWPLVPHAAAAFGLLSLMVLGIALAQSAVPTSIQAVVPNRLRGRAFALYLLLSGLMGIGFGPTAVALVGDHVFGRDSALGWAIALTAAPGALMGLGLIGLGLGPYARTHAALHPAAARPATSGAG